MKTETTWDQGVCVYVLLLKVTTNCDQTTMSEDPQIVKLPYSKSIDL